MVSSEPLITENSSYYIYTPSLAAKDLFFYPICTGLFEYLPGYSLKRNHYDSYLIMAVISGNCTIHTPQFEAQASAGDVVLLDCYSEHAYSTISGWKAYWVHCDGPLCRKYYDYITSHNGFIIRPSNFYEIELSLKKIYESFHKNAALSEPVLSLELTSIFTGLSSARRKNDGTECFSHRDLSYITSYIHEHFSESITLEQLAKMSSLSPYYFTRLFTKATGQTPHQYILSVRTDSAKFLLKTTSLSIKEIGFSCGFSSESSFNSTFRKRCGQTPGQYRNSV